MNSKELSQKASVSASYISQVESGKITPSIDVLRNIAKAMEIPVFHFFLEEKISNNVIRSNERHILKFPSVDLTYEIISSDPRNEIGVMKGILGANSHTAKEIRSHEGEECILVISGKLQLETASKTYLLEKNDSIHFDSCIPHRLININNEPCIFYLILSPPRF